MPARGVAIAAFLLALAGCADAPTEAPGLGTPDADAALLTELQGLAAAPLLVLETDMGTIQAVLYTERMPVTASRIADLAASGFYDGTLIHRVVDDFVVQGGDPTGTGEGGSGQMIPLETHPELPFGIGAVGMAQWTPGTADSQWFVVEKPAPHLSEGTDDPVASRLGPYPMFGQVVGGMEVVRAISEVEVVPGWDRPVEDIRLEAARIEPTNGVDLLALPQALEPNVALAGGTFHLQQPLHLYATHPFTVQVTVAQPPTESSVVEVVFESEDGVQVPLVLEPLDDGTVFSGSAMLTPGAWEQRLVVGGQAESWTRQVREWHPEFAPFAGPF